MRGLTTTKPLAGAIGALIAISVFATPAWADLGDPVGCDHNAANPHCDVEARNDTTYVDVGGGQVTCRDRDGREVPCHIPDVGWRGSDGCYYQQVPPACHSYQPVVKSVKSSSSGHRRSSHTPVVIVSSVSWSAAKAGSTSSTGTCR